MKKKQREHYEPFSLRGLSRRKGYEENAIDPRPIYRCLGNDTCNAILTRTVVSSNDLSGRKILNDTSLHLGFLEFLHENYK